MRSCAPLHNEQIAGQLIDKNKLLPPNHSLLFATQSDF